jgi:hypothetical protein
MKWLDYAGVFVVNVTVEFSRVFYRVDVCDEVAVEVVAEVAVECTFRLRCRL